MPFFHSQPRSNAVELPLFPLHAVLFPGGLLSLKVFESRYLDLMTRCMREQRAFGVVTLTHGSEVKKSADPVSFEPVGVMAELLDIDALQTGILQVRCRGTQRFDVQRREQHRDGLWVAQAAPQPADDTLAPEDPLLPAVRSLATAIGTLKKQGSEPFLKPYVFEDAGWVANRWCEILPISVAAKYKLMELPDPMARLRLVNDFLRSKGVLT